MMIWSKCCLATYNLCDTLFSPRSSGQFIWFIIYTQINKEKIEVGKCVPLCLLTIFFNFFFFLSHIRKKKITEGSNPLQSNGSIRGSCSLAINIPVHRHVGHITYTWKIISYHSSILTYSQIISMCACISEWVREINNGTTKDQINSCEYTSGQ